jgi:hypothetical protein
MMFSLCTELVEDRGLFGGPEVRVQQRRQLAPGLSASEAILVALEVTHLATATELVVAGFIFIQRGHPSPSGDWDEARAPIVES